MFFLSRDLGVLARYLGILIPVPLTTMSIWVDKRMVACLAGVSDMSFNHRLQMLTSRQVASVVVSKVFCLQVMHISRDW